MITKKKTYEVAVHFNKIPHDLSDFSFQCIDQVQATVNNSCRKTFNHILECTVVLFGTFRLE